MFGFFKKKEKIKVKVEQTKIERSYRTTTGSTEAAYNPTADLLNPLNPLSPLSPINQSYTEPSESRSDSSWSSSSDSSSSYSSSSDSGSSYSDSSSY